VISAAPAREGDHQLADGRRLTYAEFGDLQGRPVVLLHGNPGSRLICPDVDATVAAGVRLLTFDRPGFGGSDPRPFHQLTDVSDDLAELAAALDLGPVPVVGWSGGGPYALAAAARHPELVTAVVSLSGSGLADDPDVLAQQTGPIAALLDELRAGSAEALATVEARFANYAEDPTLVVDLTLSNEHDPDRVPMAVPAVRDALSSMWREGAKQGAAGVAAGWVALWALPRGYEPAEVRQPATVWHGADDVIVPVGQAERLAEALPTADLRVLPGEGHLTALDHWPEILASL
jgi:pimeloyl-ACP methyl ester carboxylesterase